MEKIKNQKNIDELLATKQIIVVEDDEGLNKLIQKSLRRAKFDCFGVLTGADAIAIVKKEPNIVLLIDQQLPDMDGTDLVRNLINNAHDIIFVAMTGHGDEKVAVEMMKLGARDYLIKGFDLTEILPMVFKRVFSEIKTENKLVQAEEELKKLGAAVQQSPVSIIITDCEGCIEYVNPKFCNLTGYSKQEVIGKNPNLLQSGTASPELYKNLWKTILSGKEWRGEFQNKKKNGEVYWEDALISPIFNNDGAITNFLAVKEDITERKQLEKHLLQTQKMETIGTLAGGIAHDFNNILYPIVGYTEMLLEDIPEDSPLRESLYEIFTGAMRASDLVKQILTFSRQDSYKFQFLKIQPVIKEALKLIRSTIPTTINIKQEIRDDCGIIKADPTQIHQIVMNLATNAYHAMEDNGGELKINLREITLSEQDVIGQDIEPGTYACLTVADTGIGMDKYTIGKAFDPFFTTKDRSKGTGMGLSVIHGIVKNAGGSINVYSEVGQGTEFHIYLPVVKSSSEQHELQTKESIQGGTEQILLVDDETTILKMEKQMLERLGYQVVSCDNSLKALETFQATPDEFDVVITDMAMPNMPGDKLSAELIKLRPDIPILLCTGFSERLPEEKAVSIGIKGFLMKPIVRADLSKKIREVLDD